MLKILVFILGVAAAWNSNLMAQSAFYGLFLPMVALVSFFWTKDRGGVAGCAGSVAGGGDIGDGDGGSC